ncbi:hypothetical protein P154DRAFT_569652 [Amniculicola lignicola CBS 123094]|uniref:Uncharacterized protein n=1 Tax=Amniculicola lignicola CBS 123094 TaxID=1392246 RepID=A0A6A5X2D1_9PLEO|nr:hypothetical protein P154DRAFT_569652 [Amniculicola lignicola CBS 123094]
MDRLRNFLELLSNIVDIQLSLINLFFINANSDLLGVRANFVYLLLMETIANLVSNIFCILLNNHNLLFPNFNSNLLRIYFYLYTLVQPQFVYNHHQIFEVQLYNHHHSQH